MRAVVFDLSVVKYLLAKSFGAVLPSLYYGRGSCLSLREVARPSLPDASFAKVQVDRAGLCGSDVATVFFTFSPSLSPFSSFPCVLGHEVTGSLSEVGQDARARGWKEGDRIVVNPFFGCEVRGLAPRCPSCDAGFTATCSATTRGARPPGGCVGFHSELPGGFCDEMLAHHSQLVRIADNVPSARAALTEPLAVALHAILRRPPRDGEHVLVIGGGMIGFATVAVLRLFGYTNRVTHRVRREYQSTQSLALGATEVAGSRDLLDDAVTLTGATREKPVLGRDVLAGGGFHVAYDCVGSAETLDDAMRATAARGAIVLIGGAGIVPQLDLTFIWSREIELIGSAGYSPEAAHRGRHTLDLVAERLAESDAAKLDALVTHTFPLEKYREAFAASVNHASAHPIKIQFARGTA